MLVHFRYTFPTCLPDPDHLTVLVRPGFVETACHPFFVPRFRLSPTSPTRCDGLVKGVLHPLSVQERLVALDVGYPKSIRSRSCKRSFDKVFRPLLEFIGDGGRDIGFPTSDPTDTKVTHES